MKTNKISQHYKKIYRLIGCGGLILLLASLITNSIIVINNGIQAFNKEEIFFLIYENKHLIYNKNFYIL